MQRCLVYNTAIKWKVHASFGDIRIHCVADDLDFNIYCGMDNATWEGHYTSKKSCLLAVNNNNNKKMV